jgi:cytoskeletal protein RodZ
MSQTATDYIGQQLSAARTRLGLSTSDVANRLRMRSMFVEALEREEWATIGEFVYVRGFLKNYAKLLGLDARALAEQLTADYAPEAAAPRPTLDALSGSGLSSVRTSDATASRRWFPWVLGSLTAIAAVLVVMVGISLVGTLGTGTRQHDEVAPTVAESTSGPSAALPAAPLADGLADTQAPNDGVNLKLQLTQPSWLSVAVDGKRVVYETLPAGTVREFHGVREITLRAGNAGGVVAKIDGRDLGALGLAGQVEDRVFAVKPTAEQLKTLHE